MVIGVVVFVLLAKEEQTARASANRFAAALVHDKPAAAPNGATAYVRGVRDYFGDVTSARVVGAHESAAIAIPKPMKPHIKKAATSARLRCVQQAQGDVTKLARCAN